MRKSKKTVLIVTMDTNTFGTLKRGLKTGLYGVSFANGIKEVFKSITRKPGPDFILVDDDRSPLNCLDIVEEIRDINKDYQMSITLSGPRQLSWPVFLFQ